MRRAMLWMALATAACAQTTGVIAGTAVNALTGEPVAGATMSLLDHDNAQTLAEAHSDASGRFSFGPRAAGTYVLSGARRGYLTTLLNDHGDYSSAVIVAPGQHTEQLRFEFQPLGVVRGAVTDDAGEPVENAIVTLFERTGTARNRVVTSQTTDDRGHYEFAALHAGDYLIAVQADPWFAVHNERLPELDVAYPITFWDSTNDERAASILHLATGERQTADIALHAVRALHLELAAGTHEAQQLEASVFGTMMPFNARIGAGDPLDANGKTIGPTHITGIAPGNYTLVDEQDGTVEFSASSNQLLSFTAPRKAQVHVVLEWLSTPGGTQSFDLELQPAAGSPLSTSISNSVREGRVDMEDVPVGAWTLHLRRGKEEMLVLGTTLNSTFQPGNQITLSEGTARIRLRVAATGTSARGVALAGEQPQVGAMIVAIPDGDYSAEQMELLSRRDQTDSDGSFHLHDLAPGHYTVVALDPEAWTGRLRLGWSRPGALSGYLAGGQKLVVRPSDSGEIALSGPVTVQKP